MRSKNKGFIQFKSQENIVHYSRHNITNNIIFIPFSSYIFLFSSSSSFFSRIRILFYTFISFILFLFSLLLPRRFLYPPTSSVSITTTAAVYSYVTSAIFTTHSLQPTAGYPCIPFHQKFQFVDVIISIDFSFFMWQLFKETRILFYASAKKVNSSNKRNHFLHSIAKVAHCYHPLPFQLQFRLFNNKKPQVF